MQETETTLQEIKRVSKLIKNKSVRENLHALQTMHN